MIELQEKFFKLVDETVMLNTQTQLVLENSKTYMAQGHWLEEYATVSIDAGRRMGKTTYIQKRMKPCDLVIVPRMLDVDYYYRAARKNLTNVLSAESIFNRFNMAGHWRGQKDIPSYWNKVYVDEPSQVFATRDSRYEFFNWFGSRCNQVIMLGCPVRL